MEQLIIDFDGNLKQQKDFKAIKQELNDLVKKLPVKYYNEKSIEKVKDRLMPI